MLTFRQLIEARALVEERGKIVGILARERCGLTSIGPYHFRDAIEAVEPAYRGWLTTQLKNIDAQLTHLGVDTGSPTGWQFPDGSEGGIF